MYAVWPNSKNAWIHILNTLFNGWEQNIVVTAESAGINLTIDNVVSINANSNGAFEGQGLSFAGYVPLSDHIGIGGSIFFLRLTTQANLIPGADTITKLNLAAAGNQAQFIQLTKRSVQE